MEQEAGKVKGGAVEEKRCGRTKQEDGRGNNGEEER